MNREEKQALVASILVTALAIAALFVFQLWNVSP